MLDAYIIDAIRKEERRKEQQFEEGRRIPLPIPSPVPSYLPNTPANDPGYTLGEVIEIPLGGGDIDGAYALTTTYSN